MHNYNKFTGKCRIMYNLSGQADKYLTRQTDRTDLFLTILKSLGNIGLAILLGIAGYIYIVLFCVLSDDCWYRYTGVL